jgi:hypothetical protein
VNIKWFQKVQSALPEPVKMATLRTECDFYGASKLISDKLKLNHVPIAQCMWSHGWQFFPCKYQESYNWAWKGQGFRNLVHRKDEEHFLRQHGFPDAVAVGAPFLYVDSTVKKKIPSSLLIVPFHSLDYTDRDYDDENYFLALDPFLQKFEHVAACIHPSCARKGFWLRALQRRTIPWTLGAEAYDSNGLRRVRGLFEHFGHVTSNAIGSHIPYAASCNCSVSIYGPRNEFRLSDYREDPHYKAHPQIFEWIADLENSRFVEKNYAWLFREPTSNGNDRDWALQELGHSNVKTPIQLAEIFGWGIAKSAQNKNEKAKKSSLVQRLLCIIGRD